MPEQTIKERLSTPEGIDLFQTAYAEGGSVASAARAFGCRPEHIFRLALENPELKKAIITTRDALLEGDVQDCRTIAREATPETAQVAKLRIEEIHWRAQRLMRSTYGDDKTPSVNVTTNVGLVCNEEERARLIAMRAELLRPKALPEATE